MRGRSGAALDSLEHRCRRRAGPPRCLALVIDTLSSTASLRQSTLTLCRFDAEAQPQRVQGGPARRAARPLSDGAPDRGGGRRPPVRGSFGRLVAAPDGLFVQASRPV
jgi:hypothetical protein